MTDEERIEALTSRVKLLEQDREEQEKALRMEKAYSKEKISRLEKHVDKLEKEKEELNKRLFTDVQSPVKKVEEDSMIVGCGHTEV
jgi:hypothetical protein